jgi:hypothetical protein
MDEHQNGPIDEPATSDGRKLADEFIGIAPAESPVPSRLNTLLQQFGNSERHPLLRLGDLETGIEFVCLGNVEAIEPLTQGTEAAVARLQQAFDGRLTEAFPGLKVYFGDGIISGGGEAFANDNAIIIDAAKSRMTVAEAERFLVESGSLDEGDWTKIVTPDTTYGEITIVHELGHVLEVKAHGGEGVAFEGLVHEEAPTRYGREVDEKDGPNNEDYPESLVYEVYGAHIDEARRAILHDDIQRVSGVSS